MAVRTLGKHFKYNYVNGKVIEVHTIVAPEDNQHGVVIRSLDMGNVDTIFVYGATKPKERRDTSCVRFPSDSVKYSEYFVPAGNGVFMQAADSYSTWMGISWDFLDAGGAVA